jgi:hypothetical protein
MTDVVTRRASASGSRVRRLAILATAACLCSSIAAVSAGASEVIGSPTSRVTVKTAMRIATKAASRYTEMGVTTAATDLRVSIGSDGAALVAPSWATAGSLTSAIGSATLTVTATGPSGARDGTSGQVAEGYGTAAAPYWTLYGNACFSRIQNSGGYIDSCYKINRLVNDGSTTKDYYQLEHYATAGSKGIDTIHNAWLSSTKGSSSSAMSWVDWAPKGDTTGACANQTLSVSVAGVGISSSYTRCEKWDITKYAEAGKFKNLWDCNCTLGIKGDREVAYMSVVSVAQGGKATWTLSAGFFA